MVDPGAAPRVVHDRQRLRAARSDLTGPVAVVMTMGALHEGHVALLRAARERAAAVIATIFVNPLQFGPGEDLDRYPRTLDTDLARCAAEGVDLVFVPSAAEMYPDGEPQVRMTAGRLGTVLEGAARPGHFDGVLTVVAKLLHLTAPDLAFFGQKDAQQLVLIRRMVRDLDLDCEVVGVPTVREPDGLALSSRNVYLGPADREAARALSRALVAGQAVREHGADAVRATARAVLDAEPRCRVDYLALVTEDSLTEVGSDHAGPAILAVAARVGSTRLIDNLPLVVLPPAGRSGGVR